MVLTNKKLWWPTRGDRLINERNKSKDGRSRTRGVYAFAASFMDAIPGKFLPRSIPRPGPYIPVFRPR